MQVGAELGVPGLLLFVTFLGGGFVGLARISRGPRGALSRDGPPQLAQALTASLVGWVVGAVFLSLAYLEMVYALAGLATALRKVAGSADSFGGSTWHQATQHRRRTRA